ncbi:A/G-specific adenine glycosylase [Aquimarina sp. AD10]|uniref:A/G-specific adenine glycosylase n=1 Tax=Aquimarina sp. AD10 TaxID=1714849 RepID=UPI000E4832C1|nr:A/G-specific adenine glycosylase [Aquimarina sp. AD10]AXT62182.1 A/G-specific adenine glycosylase [Aquimarina sp. AD10]RKM90623.1 A/G-specific adenine glycosylase [Aquimarina sp. AD10]
MKFSKKLITWYLQNKRSMPWRKTTDPYRIWLSEIILQQTRVAQGLPYYLSFTETFPTVFDLANANEEQVLKLWQGLGYYSRARNLHATAKYVANDLNGVFPDTYIGLLKLKGVGDYTASAIASICYKEAVPVVDGNVYRVLSRYFGIETPINSTEGVKEFKKLAISLMDHDEPADYNQAIMEFGALQCKPKNPYCIVCPLNDSCESLKNGKVTVLPVKLKKLKIKKRYFNYIVLLINNSQTIIQQRVGNGIWKGLYEFPLIENETIDITKITSDTTIKNIIEDKNYEIVLYNEDPIIHKLSHQHLYTKFYIIRLDAIGVISKNQKLIDYKDIKTYPVPILLGNFIDSFFKETVVPE